MSTLIIGLWLDDLQLGLKEGLRRVSAWQVEALGLEAFSNELNPRTLSASGRRDLARLVRNTGASLAAVRADVGGRRLADPVSLDANLGRIRQAFELARDLGAARVTIPLGFVPPSADGAHARAQATLKEALDGLMAASHATGVRPVAVAGREPAADLRQFLDACDSPGLVEVDLNPGALLARGDDPLAALNLLSARVALATVLDSFRGGSEAPFGRGDVAWPELLVAFSALSSPAPIALLAGCTRECDRAAALGATVERLKQLRTNPFA